MRQTKVILNMAAFAFALCLAQGAQAGDAYSHYDNTISPPPSDAGHPGKQPHCDSDIPSGLIPQPDCVYSPYYYGQYQTPLANYTPPARPDCDFDFPENLLPHPECAYNVHAYGNYTTIKN